LFYKVATFEREAARTNGMLYSKDVSARSISGATPVASCNRPVNSFRSRVLVNEITLEIPLSVFTKIIMRMHQQSRRHCLRLHRDD
jgi:hypothetical protein